MSAAGGSGIRDHWSNRFAFILAASGSAVGLGNIWKFPYMAGVNGGGAFVLVYLACIALIGLPILIAEIYIGRTSQQNAVAAFETLDKPGSPWKWAGAMGVLSAFLILSFYSVVGGWVLEFIRLSVTGAITSSDDETVKGFLGGLFGSPVTLIVYHSLFMILTISIVIGGISRGIERWSKILMPTLFVILLLLLGRVMFEDGFGKAMAFMFKPDWSQLKPEGILEAVGHSFFTLSLGMGAMITYGSYMNKTDNIMKTAWTVAFLDTLIALVAGAVIFSVVFTFEQEPSGGPGLMFVTLPLLFKQMTGGLLISTAFFGLVAFAALTSAISLLEVVVAYFDETKGWPRRNTTLIMGGIIWALGLLCALSFNVLAFETFAGGGGLFDVFDYLTSKITLPVGGMVIALFFGWTLGEKAVDAAFDGEVPAIYKLGLLWSARVFAPLAVFAMLAHGLGLF